MTKSRARDSASAALSGWMDQWLEMKAAKRRRPGDAMMFPADPGALASPLHPDLVTKQFKARAAKLGFPLRFHDLRGTHETLLLDSDMPVHTVAARFGHESGRPVAYLCQTDQESDQSGAEVIGSVDQDDPLTLWVRVGSKEVGGC